MQVIVEADLFIQKMQNGYSFYYGKVYELQHKLQVQAEIAEDLYNRELHEQLLLRVDMLGALLYQHRYNYAPKLLMHKLKSKLIEGYSL